MTMRNAFETLATESKQDDLNALVEALNTASASILAAVQALNGKVTACNTGAVTVSNSPTVSLDSTSLAALENISAAVSGTVSVSGSVEVSNDLGNAMPVAVSGTPTVSLDATSLSALESITAAVSGTVGVSGSVEITNDAGNAIPVSLASVPSHSVSISNSPTVAIDTASLAALESVTISNQLDQPLTLTQLQGQDVKVSLDGEVVSVTLDNSGMSSTDLQLEILNMLRLIKTTLNRLPFYDPTLNRGRMTAILESGTVTTCGTVTNMTNVGSYTWNAMVQMQNRSSWANNCGSRIS